MTSTTRKDPMPRMKPFALLLALCLGAAGAPGTSPDRSTVLPNDNTHTAGKLVRRVLTVALEARSGVWYPEGPQGRGLDSVAAFAEAGGVPSTPGPLIRVPAGTVVRGTLRNTLGRRLTVFGLGRTRGFSDSLLVAAGGSAAFEFTAT